MERPVNLACLVYQELTAFLEPLDPKEKRVIQASWVFQGPAERRELKVNQDCQELQENLDWLVFLDRWDLLDNLDHLDLLDPATGMLDLTTWRAPVFTSIKSQASEELMEDRVLQVCLDSQVNPASPVCRVRRAAKVLQAGKVSQVWMDSRDLRGQRVTEVTEERGVNPVEMEQDFQVHQDHRDLQDKLFTAHLETSTLLRAESALREHLDYLVKLVSLVLWVRRATEETLVLPASA